MAERLDLDRFCSFLTVNFETAYLEIGIIRDSGDSM